MSDKHELLVREFLNKLVVRDYDGAVALFAPDASYHVSAWREPVTGTAAIRAEFDRQAGLYSEFRYRIVAAASTQSVVFSERLDSITMGGKVVNLHWCGVFEFDADDRIASVRDYYDMKELETQLTAPAS